MNDKTPKPRWPKNEIPISEIDEVWKKLLFYGQEYANLCLAMRRAGKESVVVTGKDSADRALGYLKGWLRTLRNVVDDIQIEAQNAVDTGDRQAQEIEENYKRTGTMGGTQKNKK